MTLIIGARCSDGVIVISDSRVSRGTDLNQFPKIFSPINETFIGASGTTGVFLKFLKQVNQKVQSGEIDDWDNLVEVLEDLVMQYTARYYRRVNGSPIDVIIGFKPSENDSELHHITAEGVAEEIRSVIAIGHGEPYASVFLKTMWRSDMTMRQTAILGSLILEVIDTFGLDSSVDNIMQIGYLPYDGKPYPVSKEEIQNIKSDGVNIHDKFIESMENMMNELKPVKEAKISESE